MPMPKSAPGPTVGAQIGLRLAHEVVKRLGEISTTLKQLLALQQSPRKNFLSAGTSPGGGTVGTSPASCNVQVLGQAPGTILGPNPHRRGLAVQNTSTSNTLTLGLGITQPTAGAGIVLPAGASWDGRLSGQLWLGSVSVVGSAAGTTFAYLEAMGPSSRTPPNEAV